MPRRSFDLDLTDEQDAQLQRLAADFGLSVPDYLHAIVIERLKPTPTDADVAAGRKGADDLKDGIPF